MAYVQDVENIPRDAYRHLAALESKLPREYAVSQIRQKINAYMKELIPINFIDLNSAIIQNPLEEPDITDLLKQVQLLVQLEKTFIKILKKFLNI